MSDGRSPTNNDSLRRAAILIAALDHKSADALLEQMPEEQAAQIRHAVMELDAVSDSEQQETIQRFLQPKPTDSGSSTSGVRSRSAGRWWCSA